MALKKRGGIWYFRKMINGRLFRESTGFADKKAAERRANEIELDIRAGVHGCKSTIPSFAEWWAVYRETYTPLKSARNRDAQIVAHFLPHFGARRLDEITKSDIVRYLNLRRTRMTGNPGHKNRRLVSESTVRRERGLLQSIFERAIDEGHDIRNPFRGIKRGKDKPRTRVLTLDEEMEPHARRLRLLTPHALRHTFGTRWLQAGGDIYKLSKILGHSSVAVTEQHYAHLLKEDLMAASQQVRIPVAPRPGGNVIKMRPRRSTGPG